MSSRALALSLNIRLVVVCRARGYAWPLCLCSSESVDSGLYPNVVKDTNPALSGVSGLPLHVAIVSQRITDQIPSIEDDIHDHVFVIGPVCTRERKLRKQLLGRRQLVRELDTFLLRRRKPFILPCTRHAYRTSCQISSRRNRLRCPLVCFSIAIPMSGPIRYLYGF